jgi:hypothetical protein
LFCPRYQPPAGFAYSGNVANIIEKVNPLREIPEENYVKCE